VVYIDCRTSAISFRGDSFGEIESVKAVSDLYSPVSGEVIAKNEQLETDPGAVGRRPYG